MPLAMVTTLNNESHLRGRASCLFLPLSVRHSSSLSSFNQNCKSLSSLLHTDPSFTSHCTNPNANPNLNPESAAQNYRDLTVLSYRDTAAQNYKSVTALCYRDTAVQSYRDLAVQSYRDGVAQSYRNLTAKRYRNVAAQSYSDPFPQSYRNMAS